MTEGYDLGKCGFIKECRKDHIVLPVGMLPDVLENDRNVLISETLP